MSSLIGCLISTQLVLNLNFGFSMINNIPQNRKYLWGDFFTDPNLKGPGGQTYPREYIDRLYDKGEFQGFVGNSRRGKTLMKTMDPLKVQNTLLQNYGRANSFESSHSAGRVINSASTSQNMVIGGVVAEVKMSDDNITKSDRIKSSSCPQVPSVPGRLCPTKYNTTAPMYGVSLTSGKPVTIVQKFPDLLQQVIFEVCQSDECDVVHGKCVQTYVPYLFLVIPLGPVTLTGQDYVLVESGCVCQPKYGRGDSIPSPVDALNIG